MFKITNPNLDANAMVEPTTLGLEDYDDQLVAMNYSLNNCKNQLDKPYENDKKNFEYATSRMEQSYIIKEKLRKELKIQFPTNALAKCIEISNKFDLISFAQNRKLRMFDNASAPGSFILAMNYLTKQKGIEFDWMASTYLSSADNTALGDRYGIMRNHMSRFTTTNTPFNGDTTDTKYLRYIQDKYDSSFDLYTSDLGVEIPHGKYHLQEQMNARPNLGQILFGLLVVRKGGAFFTKQYHHFSTFTMSLILIVASSFENVYLYKPISSKPDNSEVYIVGLNYIGTPEWMIDLMYKKLEEPWQGDDLAMNFTLPLIAPENFPAEFKKELFESLKYFADSQCAKLTDNINEYYRMLDAGERTPSPEFIAKHVTGFVKQYFATGKFTKQNKRDYMRTTMLKKH